MANFVAFNGKGKFNGGWIRCPDDPTLFTRAADAVKLLALSASLADCNTEIQKYDATCDNLKGGHSGHDHV